MPVPGMVKYDCTVSLRTKVFTNSTTIIVELPDNMERYPIALEDALFKGVVKRLKMVVFELISPNGPQSHYRIQVYTDRGFNLGTLTMVAPHSTGWWDGEEVSLVENYFPTEIEGYIASALRSGLNIRINQRTPPLPRSLPDETGQRPPVFSGDLFDDPEWIGEAKRQIEGRVKDAVFRTAPSRGLGNDVTVPSLLSYAFVSEDVTTSGRDTSALDTGRRVGIDMDSGADNREQDVAELGVELNL